MHAAHITRQSARELLEFPTGVWLMYSFSWTIDEFRKKSLFTTIHANVFCLCWREHGAMLLRYAPAPIFSLFVQYVRDKICFLLQGWHIRKGKHKAIDITRRHFSTSRRKCVARDRSTAENALRHTRVTLAWLLVGTATRADRLEYSAPVATIETGDVYQLSAWYGPWYCRLCSTRWLARIRKCRGRNNRGGPAVPLSEHTH